MPHSRTNEAKRLPGLDALRCLAIVAVLLYHYPKSSHQVLLRAVGHYGWIGVDLFFVLSGYLVAGQLFAARLRGKPISTFEFYRRRWLRILPNYFVVLACYAALSLARSQTIAPLGRYLIFSQNYGLPVAFSQSWSLCIEQHFYLLFPGVLALLAGSRARHVGLVLFLWTMIAGFGLRWLLWSHYRPDLESDPGRAWELFLRHIYYPTHTRLTALPAGWASQRCSTFEVVPGAR